MCELGVGGEDAIQCTAPEKGKGFGVPPSLLGLSVVAEDEQ